MSPLLSVNASPTAEAAGAVGSVIASLPVSLGPGSNDADIRAISGRPGWTAAALTAIAGGARGVLVVEHHGNDGGFRGMGQRRGVFGGGLDHQHTPGAACNRGKRCGGPTGPP